MSGLALVGYVSLGVVWLFLATLAGVLIGVAANGAAGVDPGHLGGVVGGYLGGFLLGVGALVFVFVG